MTNRSDDITIYMAESPRILILKKTGVGDMTEIIMQDLADSIRYIEKERAQMDDLPLLKTSGKQDLGGGVSVGITNTLLNTQWGFEARTTSVSSGTVTTGNSDGILLTDSAANFIIDGVTKGALVLNLTDIGAVGTVLRVVDLNNLLLTQQMVDGSDNIFEIGDSYKVWNVVQCIVSGGNLVAVEADLVTTLDAIFPTVFTQVVLTSSSSATLQELAAIQYASFGGGVTIDVINGEAGTSGTIGNKETPSNNLADAKSIAVTRGFTDFFIRGDITFEATDNIDGYKVIGQGHGFSTFTFISGCSASTTEFRNADMQGTLDGGDQLIFVCNIHNLINFSGIMYNCTFHDTIVLDGSSDIHFHDCKSGVVGTGTPTVDMGGSGRGLGIRAYAGGIRIINKTGSESIIIDLISGQVKIESTVTTGDIVIRGVGLLTYNYGTANVNIDGLVSIESVTGVTWDTIFIDTVNGYSGTTFPIGTAGSPVDNITDAKTIADREGIKKYNVNGSITLDDDYSEWVFEADNNKKAMIILNNQNTDLAVFNNIGISGTQNGYGEFKNCRFAILVNLYGRYVDCIFDNDITIKQSTQSNIIDSIAGAAVPITVNMNGSTMLGLINFLGYITITNMTNPAAFLGIVGKTNIYLHSSLIYGTLIVADHVIYVDLGIGENFVIIDKNITTKVWDESIADHQISGSTGKKVDKIDKKISTLL